MCWFFSSSDVIMMSDFYQTPLVKDSWIFQSINDIVNALTPIFYKHMSNFMNEI
jgi:hypothetical protein